MGEVPQWYSLIKAAQYLRTTPWELEDQPYFWMAAAEEGLAIEAWWQEQQQQDQRKRAN